MTLRCEDGYSKLVEVVTVADVSDEDRVGNCLVFIADSDLEHFCQDFEVEVQPRF